MSNLAHFLSAFFSAVSLLLSVLATALWVRSFSTADELDDSRLFIVDRPSSMDGIDQQLIRQETIIMCFRGEVSLSRSRLVPEATAGPEVHWNYWHWDCQLDRGVDGPARRLGFAFERQKLGSGSFVQVIVPLWAVVVMAAITPTWWLLRWGKDRGKPRLGHRCCGFDLTGNGGVCPESRGLVSLKTCWTEPEHSAIPVRTSTQVTRR